MILLSLIPQIHLWVLRGRNWNGAYVSSQGDEPLYSAYVNALINGRTRKNDPFGARDSSANAPLPESLFSIQFVPAYAIALPAQLFGASASTAFIILMAAGALLASLSVFAVLNTVTRDHRLAVSGTLFVLCFGALAGGNGLIGILLKSDLTIPSLPFLRRYEPAAVFPLFFILQALLWQALMSKSKRGVQVSAIVAGLTLAILVFSYFYLWTAAAAWLACIGVLWVYFRASDRQKTLKVLSTIAVIALIALVPYFYMVSHQATLMDEQKILISTHRPDLLRVDEILGALILVALRIEVVRNRIERTDPRIIFVASLALLPFLVFNQQILTGKTLQAYHYEAFVVNYTTLVAVVVVLPLAWGSIRNRHLVFLAVLSFSWGMIEVGLPARLAYVPSAIVKDQGVPVLLRLKELSALDGTLADIHSKRQASTLVYSPEVSLIAWLPTWTSQATLLDISGVYCGNVTSAARKEFFYMHLYYSGAGSEKLLKSMKERDQFSIDVLFGHQRLFPALGSQFQPLEDVEIEREVQAYEAYANSLSRERLLKRPITYAVIPLGVNFDFKNLDRWYERNAGENVGDYTLYRLKLRD